MKWVQHTELRQLLERVLVRLDLSERHRQWMIDGLVEPSLRGVDSHGIRLLPTYLAELRGGRAKISPTLNFNQSFLAITQLDADQAPGLVAGFAAMEHAVEQARKLGVGIVSVRNANHFGAASNFTLAAAEQGMIGLCMSNADALVAPHNGLEKQLGTNPISFAAKGSDGQLFCLDMATSQVSFSKVARALDKGQAIDSDWLADDQSTPQAVDEIGALAPLGGYKGQGLGMMVGIMAGLLNNCPLDKDMSHLYEKPFDKPRHVGFWMMALNIEAFTCPSTFAQNLTQLMSNIRAGKTSGDKPIEVAGDREWRTKAQRIEQGIPLTDKELGYLNALAQEHGLKALAVAEY